jgi:hypothetical protein
MPHLCIKYAHLPFEVRNRFRMTHSRRVRSNPQRKDHPQCHHSTGHLTTMILSNDPRYGSHLAGDHGQFSLLQILIEDVLKGQ